jgi:hypothetical protein
LLDVLKKKVRSKAGKGALAGLGVRAVGAGSVSSALPPPTVNAAGGASSTPAIVPVMPATGQQFTTQQADLLVGYCSHRCLCVRILGCALPVQLDLQLEVLDKMNSLEFLLGLSGKDGWKSGVKRYNHSKFRFADFRQHDELHREQDGRRDRERPAGRVDDQQARRRT